MKILHNRAFWPVVFMALCAVCLGYMQFLTPYQNDDILYGRYWKDAMYGSGRGMNWSECWEFIKVHYMQVNGRLPDKFIVAILSNFPKWLEALIATIACMSINFFGSKAAFGSVSKHPKASLLLTAMLSLLMPWGDEMFTVNMQLNYCWGAGVWAPVLWLFLRPPHITKCPRLASCAIFLLSFLAGSWHEGCAIPFICGAVIYLIVYRKDNTLPQYIIFLGMLLGLLFILTAPGTWVRINGTELGDHQYAFLNNLLKGGYPGFIFTAAFAICFAVKPWRKRIGREQMKLCWMCLGIFMFSLGLFLCAKTFKRVFWYGNMASIIGCATLLAAELRGLRIWAKRLIMWLFIGATLAHFAFTIPYYRCLVKEYADIIALYEKSPEGDIFYDYHGRGFGPLITLQRARIFILYQTRGYLNIYFHNFDHYPLSITPTRFRNFDPGRFHTPKEMLNIDGFFISNDQRLATEDVIFPLCTLENGRELILPVYVNMFRAADGSKLFYLEPDERQSGGKRVNKISYDLK